MTSIGVPGGVVDEVPNRLREGDPVSPYPSGPHSGGLDREPGPADTSGLGNGQVVEVHVVEGAGDLALVGPREQQQLLDEPLHACRLLQHGISELTLGQRTRVRAHYLGRLPHAGKWRTQLVRRVGDELLLPAPGVLETSQHRVHGQCESMDFVAGARFGHPPVQLVTGDLLDLESDAFDRCEGPGGHSPGGAAHEHQHQGEADQQRGDQRRRRVVDLLQRDGDRDEILLLTDLGVVGQHDVLVVGTGKPGRVSILGGQRLAERLRRAHDRAVGVGHLPDEFIGVVGVLVVVSRPSLRKTRGLDLVGDGRGTLLGTGLQALAK